MPKFPARLLTNSHQQRHRRRSTDTISLLSWALTVKTATGTLTASKRAFRSYRWYLDNLVLACFLRTVVMWLVSLFALQPLMDVCWLVWGCPPAPPLKSSALPTGTRPCPLIKEQSQLHGCYANTTHWNYIIQKCTCCEITFSFYFEHIHLALVQEDDSCESCAIMFLSSDYFHW